MTRSTLAFFGLKPGLAVVELAPGGGWYSEILAPYLRPLGRFYLAHFAADSANAGQRRSRTNFAERLAQAPAVYGGAVLATLPGPNGSPDVPAGSIDLVLTFRNVHNWVSDSTLDDKLRVIKDGLSSGDRVVVNGLARVRPNQKVTPQEQGAGPAGLDDFLQRPCHQTTPPSTRPITSASG